jgi:hypothetical protein
MQQAKVYTHLHWLDQFYANKFILFTETQPEATLHPCVGEIWLQNIDWESDGFTGPRYRPYLTNVRLITLEILLSRQPNVYDKRGHG